MRRISRRSIRILYWIIGIGALVYAVSTGHVPDTAPPPAGTIPAGMSVDQVLQQIADDPTITHPAWTPPIAVYTVTTPNHPGEPCRVNPSCAFRPGEPSKIDVFLHPGDPYVDEGPTYGEVYCRDEMVEQAVGTTCTVRDDPGSVAGVPE